MPRRSEQLGQLRVLRRWIDGVDRPPPALALLGVGLGTFVGVRIEGRRRLLDDLGHGGRRLAGSADRLRRVILPLDLDRLGLLGRDGLRRVDGRLDPLGQPEITLAGALDGKPHLGVQLFEVGDDVTALADEAGDLLLDPARPRRGRSLGLREPGLGLPGQRLRLGGRGLGSLARVLVGGSAGLGRVRVGLGAGLGSFLLGVRADLLGLLLGLGADLRRCLLGVERTFAAACSAVERSRSASARASEVSRSALSWALERIEPVRSPTSLIARWITARRASSSPPVSSQSASSAR